MAKQPRPYIGVNADLFVPAAKQAPSLRLALGYVDSIVAAGGLPVIVPPLGRDIDPDAYLDNSTASCCPAAPATWTRASTACRRTRR